MIPEKTDYYVAGAQFRFTLDGMTTGRIAVIGGGFAGRQACRALRGTRAEVLLFDPNRETVMLPALPDLAGGWLDESLLQTPLNRLLPKNVRLIQAPVSSVDLNTKTLTAGGEPFSFERLLIASGSMTDFHGMAPHRERIHHLDSVESALRIRKEFPIYLKQTDNPHLVLAGGGYTGLELAMSLCARAQAEAKPCRVTILDRSADLLPFLPESKRRYIQAFLARNGVTVLSGEQVTGFDGACITAGSRVFESVFFCWTGGSAFAGPEIKGDPDRLPDGRLKVNPDLSLPGHPDVFAAGDSAAFEKNGNFLRKSVNFAWYQGLCAGRNLARRHRGKQTRPFRPVDAGWVIPLHTDSTGQLFSRIWIRGNTGLRLHYFMCGFRNTDFPRFAGFAKIALKLSSIQKRTIP